MTTTDERTGSEKAGYNAASTGRVTAGNGIEYAYRDLGDSDVPLILLQHFRGNLDNWDPALVDALAAQRRVVTVELRRRRRHDRRDAEHDRGDGARRDRLHRGDGTPAR